MNLMKLQQKRSVHFQAHCQVPVDIKCQKLKSKWRPKAFFKWPAWLGGTIGREMLSLKPHVSQPAGPSPLAEHSDTQEMLSVPEFHKCPVEFSSLVCTR